MMLLIALEFTGANLARDLILAITVLSLLTGTVLFLIFYGIAKKKKAFWISGFLLAILSILGYFSIT
jgi:zinc transporter ZupT